MISDKGRPVDLSVTSSREAQQDLFRSLWQDRYLDAARARSATVYPMRSQERVSDDAVLQRFYQTTPATSICAPDGRQLHARAWQVLTAGVNRNRSGRVFSDEEEAQLVRVMRHIQRALQMRRRFQGVEVRAQAGFAPRRLAFAAVVVDAGAALLSPMPKGGVGPERAGLTLGGGRIGCCRAEQARDFASLIRTAASGGVGGAMRITDRSGETALLALLRRCPAGFQTRKTVTGWLSSRSDANATIQPSRKPSCRSFLD